MTTLDQAFIKAYLHEDEAPRAPLRSPEPVRLDDALGELSAAEPAGRAPDVAAAQLAQAVADALGNHGPATAAIGWSITSQPPATESPEATRIDSAAESTPSLDDLGPVSFVALLDSQQSEPLEPSEQVERSEAAQGDKGLSEEAWTTEAVHPGGNEQPTDHLSAEDQEPETAAERAEDPAETARVFQPLLRVERLKWPSDCDRLDREAASEVDRLADSLLKESAEGRNVLGFGAGALSEGTTTMLLCAARRLAARGVKVVVVDADFDHPSLALRLRLAVQSGWEDALADRVALDEVVIESDHDGLALLPWREPCSPKDPPTAGEPDPAPSIRLLSERYDLVLVDLGKLDDQTLAGIGVFAPLVRWIDAVILVHNVRDTPPADLDRLRHRVRTCGLAEAGVTENFA